MLTKKVFVILSITISLKLVNCYVTVEENFDFQHEYPEDSPFDRYEDYQFNQILPDDEDSPFGKYEDYGNDIDDADFREHENSLNQFQAEMDGSARDDFIQATIDEHYHTQGFPESEFLYTRSPLHLMYLADMDREIYNGLLKYSDHLRWRLELVDQYIKDFEDYSLNPGLDASNPNPQTALFSTQEWNWSYKVSSHPITALQLLQRLTSQLPTVLQAVESGAEAELVEQISHSKASLYWPQVTDIEETKNKLLDLHQTYDFELEKFTNGDILGLSTNNLRSALPVRPLLSPELCHELGLHALKNEKYASAVEWMSLAKSKVGQENDTRPERMEIFGEYESVALIHDTTLKANALEIFVEEKGGGHDLFIDDVDRLSSFKGSKVKDLYLKKRDNFFDVPPHIIENRLCNGGNWQDPTVGPTLHCFLHTKNHPYLILSPYKIEILNHRPQVILIHDLFTPALGLDMIELSINAILDDPSHRNHLTPPPVSVEEEVITKLNNLRNHFGYLRSFHNQRNDLYREEKFLTQSYSYGFNANENDFYPDILTDETSEFREQETFILHLYFRDVEAGGYTIFPDLGISVKPNAGSALVFQTVKRQGFLNSPYNDLVWKNCPVISGIKWVGTKYFRQVGNNLKFDHLYKSKY